MFILLFMVGWGIILWVLFLWFCSSSVCQNVCLDFVCIINFLSLFSTLIIVFHFEALESSVSLRVELNLFRQVKSCKWSCYDTLLINIYIKLNFFFFFRMVYFIDLIYVLIKFCLFSYPELCCARINFILLEVSFVELSFEEIYISIIIFVVKDKSKML